MKIVNKDFNKKVAIKWFDDSEKMTTAKDYCLNRSFKNRDKKVLDLDLRGVLINLRKNKSITNRRNMCLSPSLNRLRTNTLIELQQELFSKKNEKTSKLICEETTITVKAPWQLSSSQIDIIDIFEAEVTGEIDNDYTIEFRDAQMEIVEATLSKNEFNEHPEPVSIGTPFGIVLYKQQGDPATKIGAWPIEKYWNKSLSN